MKNRNRSIVKTLGFGVIVGVIANCLTNMTGYFGTRVVHTVSHVLTPSIDLKDSKGHKITYESCPTAKTLLECVFEGDVIAEPVERITEKVFSFAHSENLPCSAIPLLSLIALQKMDITLVVDDSTSMGIGANSRWEDCKKLVKLVVKYGLTSQDNSISIRFLNDAQTYSITNLSMVDALFAKNPRGGTPLIKTLDSVLDQIKKQDNSKRELVYVFTDGIPDDGNYYDPTLTWVREIFSSDRSLSNSVAINFVLADSNPSIEREYLQVDNFVPPDGRALHIDTNFVYASEQARCSNFHLTEGLYKLKILLGAMNEDLHELDDSNENSHSSERKRFIFLKDAWSPLRELNASLL